MDRAYGYIPDNTDSRDELFLSHHPILSSINLPKKSDRLLPFLPPKCDQLQIGCCSAASTTRAVKAFMNSTNYPFEHMPSCFFLYSEVREFEGAALDNDTGARLRDIFKVWNEKGVCPEDSNSEWSWPFSASDDRWKTRPNQECYDHAARHKISYKRVGNTEEEIKTALCAGFPIVIGISIFSSFESEKVARTGIIPKKGLFDKLAGEHAVWLWGYGNESPNYADGANSWGPEWGDHGNFHINFRELCNPEFTQDLWAVTGIT